MQIRLSLGVEESPDLQDCIPLDLQDKCLWGQLRWQDLTTVPGTEGRGQRADTGKGTVPGPAIASSRRGRSLGSRVEAGTQGQDPHAPGGAWCFPWDPVFRIGPGGPASTCARWDCVCWGSPVLQGRPGALGVTYCSKRTPEVQAVPSDPGKSQCCGQAPGLEAVGIPGQL